VAVRRQRLAGIAFALIGLALATWSAMNLATNADDYWQRYLQALAAEGKTRDEK